MNEPAAVRKNAEDAEPFSHCGWRHEPREDGWPRQSEEYRHTGGSWECGSS